MAILNPPSKVTFSDVTDTSLMAYFTDPAYFIDGPIIGRQIGYGTHPSSVQHTVSSDKSTLITGLTKGTLYYFWARVQNADGFSGWSPRASVTTLNTPPQPGPLVVSEISQVSMKVVMAENGGGIILQRQVIRNTVNDIGTGTTTDYNDLNGITLTGLLPATTYYLWSRTRNAAGWSPYSPLVVAKTIAGAYVKVGAVYKQAVPWVKDGGVWKKARPWSRVAGVWRETL